jgi:hypothetical protein
VLVVLAAVGGGVSYATYVEPGTVTESEPVGQWGTTAGYTHSATVVEDTEAFPAGTVLENRETYFTEVAPVLDARFSIGSTRPRARSTSPSRPCSCSARRTRSGSTGASRSR